MRPQHLDIHTWHDERSWAGLIPLDPLVSSGHGGPARQNTRVRGCCDQDDLWFRFDCDDDDPHATLTERDAPLFTADVVELFLAPGASTPTVYYEFEVNPLGALFDARVSSPRGSREGMTVDVGWDCEGVDWGARIHRPRGWAAWLRIPRASCGGEPRSTTWRANFFRIDDPGGPRAEYCAWSPTGMTPPDFHRPGRFGSIVLREP